MTEHNTSPETTEKPERKDFRLPPPVDPNLSPLDAELRRHFWDAVTVVDRSQAAVMLDGVLVKRSSRTNKPIGRPRTITPRAVLVGSLVNYMQEGTGEITAITKTLNVLPLDLLDELGLAQLGVGGIPHHKVDHMWNRMVEACNPSPVRDGKRLRIVDNEVVVEIRRKNVDPKFLRPELTEEELYPEPSRKPSTRGTARPLTTEQADERRTLLNAVCDSLVQATVPLELPLGLWAADWTDHETWANTYRNDKETSADPDARWGRRRPKGNRISLGALPSKTDIKKMDEATGNDAFEDDKKELFYGYNVHFITTTPLETDPTVPTLTGAIRVAHAADMAGTAPALVDMVDSMLEAELPVNKVLIDKGYSMRTPETWAIPLAERGVFAGFELESHKLARNGSLNGAPLIGGVPHCPRIPEELMDLDPVPGPSASREEFKAYWERYEAREAYAFATRGKLEPGLNIRFDCPAYRNKVRCEHKPQSLSISADKNIPEIYDPPKGENAPKCCTQDTMKPPKNFMLNYRQEHAYGSKKWVLEFEHRTAVERYNSSFKYEQRTNRHEVRVMGLAKTSLVLTMAAVATNIRHLRNWQATTGEVPSTLGDAVTQVEIRRSA